MTDLIKVILDEGGPDKSIVRKGYCQIVPSMRFPDTTDGLIVGRITADAFFDRSSEAPYVMLLPCDLVGPQTDDGPGWNYLIKYSTDFPGRPQTWAFNLLSTNGSEQKLSDLAVVPAARPGQAYVPWPNTPPDSGQVFGWDGTKVVAVDQDTAGGAVTSVNDVEPISGNVVLTAENVGALAPDGDGSDLTGLTQEQITGLATALAAFFEKTGGVVTGPIIIQVQGSYSSFTLTGEGDDAQYSNFQLADGVYPLDGEGHYWSFSHRTDGHLLQIYNYNGASYTVVLTISEDGGIATAQNTLDDGSGNAAIAGKLTVPSVATHALVVTTAYTVTSTDFLIEADATSAPLTVTLPDATTCQGQLYAISKIDASHNVTVATIDGQLMGGVTSLVLTAQNQAVLIMSDGSSWQILAGAPYQTFVGITTSGQSYMGSTDFYGNVDVHGNLTTDNNTLDDGAGNATIAGAVQAGVFKSAGLTGATNPARFVGGTSSGAPASGTFTAGDFIVDGNGHIWVCYAGGSPGSWSEYLPANTNTGNIQPSPGTAAAGVAGFLSAADHVHGQPPMFAPTGLPGATVASRYVGGTNNGPPSSGSFLAGDFVVDNEGQIWVCNTAGSPGSWSFIMQRNAADSSIQPSPGTRTAGSVFNSADAGHVHGQPPMFAPTGLTGATAASRYVGGSSNGGPSSGTFALGDFTIDPTSGRVWICTTGGSPGTWSTWLLRDGTTSDIQPSPGTAAAGSTFQAADASHVHGQPPMFAPTGLTGATAASRYVGATTSGSPVSGTFSVGDFVIDQTGVVNICTSAGTPGTWAKIVQRNSTDSNIQPVGTAASSGSTFEAADAGHVHGSPLWLPGDDGLLAASWDPGVNSGNYGVARQVVQLVRIPIRSSMTVAKLVMRLIAAGSGPEDVSYVGLYLVSGTTITLLTGSSDITSTLTAAGQTTIQLPFSSSQVLSPGYVFGAMLQADGWTSSAPAFAASNSQRGANNAQVGSGWERLCEYNNGGSGVTTLPGTINKSDLEPVSFYSQAVWMGLV